MTAAWYGAASPLSDEVQSITVEYCLQIARTAVNVKAWHEVKLFMVEPLN